MKVLGLLVLLCLASLVSAGLNTGLYDYQTNVFYGGAAKPTMSLSASVVISPVFSEGEEAWYSLKLVSLTLSQGGEDTPLTLTGLPFQFSRLSNGQINAVRVHPDETLDIENIKKAIAESLQTSLSLKTEEVEEVGGNGVRVVTYSVLRKNAREATVQGEYGRRDFVSFAAGTNMANVPFSLSATKTSRVNLADGAVLAASATTQIRARHTRNRGPTGSVDITTTTEVTFTSGEIALIDVIEEADWKVETLVHEVNPASRLEGLKARLPSVQSLVASLQDQTLPLKEALKLRGYLVTLMNADQASLEAGLATLVADLQAAPKARLPLLYSTLSMINGAEAQQALAAELTAATEAGNADRVATILKGLVAVGSPADTSALLASVQTTLSASVASASSQVRALGELTLGHLAKLLPTQEAAELLLPFVKQLETAVSEGDKIQLLHVLGNAGNNSPVPLIASFIHDASLQVRAAALSNLRTAMHLAEVQSNVVSMMQHRPNRQARSIISSLVTAVKHTAQENDLGGEFKQFLTDLAKSEPAAAEAMSTLSEYLAETDFTPVRSQEHHRRGPNRHHQEQEPKFASTTDIWNDTSDANYNLVAPISQRQEDVTRYPSYNAYLFSQQIGPRFTNLKIVGGAFSGSGDDACLAGDFKIFDKLYSETHVFGNTTVIADLQLYILTFENSFESRVYAIVNGNTLIDFSISSNCSSEELAIYEGVISILDYTTEIPIDLGNLEVYAYVYAGVTLDAGYELCLLTLNPYVELWITGQVDLVVDAGATLTALGVIRGGLEGDLYANFAVGPDTQLGSIINSTTGEHVCKACIGVYYGYEDQTGYVGLFLQRREGLGWGDKVTVPIAEFVEPGVPFPTPLIEACSEDVTPVPNDFEVIKRHNAN